MSGNQFEENEKEKLEKEIEELKKQKEIKDLQKQKEELEREIFGNNEKSAENIDFYEEETENKYVSNKMTTILAAIVAVIIAIFAGGLFYLRSQNKKRENLKKQMAATSQNKNSSAATNSASAQSTTSNPSTSQIQKKKDEKSKQVDKINKNEEKQERLIVRKSVDVRKGSYCVNPSSSQSYFNTSTVSDPGADHPYMADIHFSDCVVYGTHSEGTYNGRHTGPITMTVSLAEEKNFEAVMKRNKWYLENGEIMRINGYDYNNVYFNGWLMYKQTQ